MTAERLVQVAVFAPVTSPLTYTVPARLEHLARPGCRVLVSLGRRRGVLGVVLGPGRPHPDTALRPVSDVLDAEPLLDPPLLDLLLWTASYYMAPPGEVIRAALPTALHSHEKQHVQLTDEGRRVLTAQTALLRSQSDDLSARELDLLGIPAPLTSREQNNASSVLDDDI